jgi:hypothetical protein
MRSSACLVKTVVIVWTPALLYHVRRLMLVSCPSAWPKVLVSSQRSRLRAVGWLAIIDADKNGAERSR